MRSVPSAQPVPGTDMGEFLADLVEWMTALPALWAYGLILLIAYGENVVPPIPGDMVVVFGGYLVGVGKLNMFSVILLSTIGGALGFMTMYAIGYRIGLAVLDPDRLRWLPKAKIQTVRTKLQRWGFGVVVANRFLSGLRSVISLTVGMAHMSPMKTTVYATISSAIWTTLIAWAGYFVGENWAVVSGYLRTYGWVVMGLILVFTAVQVVYYLRSRNGQGDQREQSADPVS
jgi:membrane protein DedA with SNARE-associated domain